MANAKDRLTSLGSALLTLLSSATPTGLLVPNAHAMVVQEVPRRREDEKQDGTDAVLLIEANAKDQQFIAGHRSHSSHRSHRSHSSHYSGRGHYSSGGGYVPSYKPEPEPAPAPPKPANVSFAAVPGGEIFVDGKASGRDKTKTLKLDAGKHTIRIENAILGSHVKEVELTAGQSGVVEIRW